MSTCCGCGRTVEGIQKVRLGVVHGRAVTSRLCRECQERGGWPILMTGEWPGKRAGFDGEESASDRPIAA